MISNHNWASSGRCEQMATAPLDLSRITGPAVASTAPASQLGDHVSQRRGPPQPLDRPWRHFARPPLRDDDHFWRLFAATQQSDCGLDVRYRVD
jgi:hypothetical protein